MEFVDSVGKTHQRRRGGSDRVGMLFVDLPCVGAGLVQVAFCKTSGSRP